MYEVRGYTYTEDPKFLGRGKKSLEQVKKHLKEAKAHAASSPAWRSWPRRREGRDAVHGIRAAAGANRGLTEGHRRPSASTPRRPRPSTWKMCDEFLKDQNERCRGNQGRQGRRRAEGTPEENPPGQRGHRPGQLDRHRNLEAQVKRARPWSSRKPEEFSRRSTPSWTSSRPSPPGPLNLKQIEECRGRQGLQGAAWTSSWPTGSRARRWPRSAAWSAHEVLDVPKPWRGPGMTDTPRPSRKPPRTRAGASTVHDRRVDRGHA